MAISKVIYGNNTLIDISNDTVTANKLASGYTAHDSAGNAITGTGSIASLNPGIDKVNDFVGESTYETTLYAASSIYIYKNYFIPTSAYTYSYQSNNCYDVSNCVIGESIELYTKTVLPYYYRMSSATLTLYVYPRSNFPNIKFYLTDTDAAYAILDVNRIVRAKGTITATTAGATIALPASINPESGIYIVMEGLTQLSSTSGYLYAVPTT